MKLAEALMERKDIVKKISRVTEEIMALLVTPAFEKVDSAVIKSKIGTHQDLVEALSALNVQIDKANVVLIDKLNALRTLDSHIGFCKEIRAGLIGEKNRFRYSENEYSKNIELYFINDLLEAYEKQRRALDREIQGLNWTINI